MEDDLIACLTRQVKEDVVEHYLTERRIIEMQIEDFQAQVRLTDSQAVSVGARLTRLAFLMIDEERLDRLRELLGVDPGSFWCTCIESEFHHAGVSLIRVVALTTRNKYRKLIVEAYRRLHKSMQSYKKAYDELEAERRAVNLNIKKFHNNFDLLTIINFLKCMDVYNVERKKILGENFSAEELTAIDKKLYFRQLSMSDYNIAEPIELPSSVRMEEALGRLADDVYRRYEKRLRRILR